MFDENVLNIEAFCDNNDGISAILYRFSLSSFRRDYRDPRDYCDTDKEKERNKKGTGFASERRM